MRYSFLWLTDQDFGLPCSFGLEGKASIVDRDVGSDAVLGWAMVRIASGLGVGEALNRSLEPFGDLPARESSMVTGGS